MPPEEAEEWQELASLLGVDDATEECSAEARAARARRAFVATLAEWVQMHDYHTPFCNGPPSKGPACAKVENEHSLHESISCGELFPRKVIESGMDEVSEDPRRK